MKKKLHVISHTHWDREWYQDFQSYRIRLIKLVDELLDHLEKDSEYKYFHMDGQTIVLEDYLEIKPENEERLRKLIGEGRIIIGPWYNMPDEFLVSGESLIRNILMGHRICSDYGVQPMKNGYVTDIFGHNSQFPQILKGFDIDSATLYRGIGDYEKAEFTWEGADGSQVLALKLDEERSYSNFYFAIRKPFDGRNYEKDEVIQRMTDLLDFMEPKATTSNYIMMDGVDHVEIEPLLPELMNMIGEMDDVEIVHTRLDQFVKEIRKENPKLDTIRGELRKPAYRGINNQILNDVLSSMVHLKQMNDRCEILLTKWVEPFSCICESMGLGRYPAGLINRAWKYLIQNHPHDSICGCSITKVHKDNEYRFNQAGVISEEIIEENLTAIEEKIDTSIFSKGHTFTVFNSSQTDIDGVVIADIEIPSHLLNDLPNWKTANILILNDEKKEVPYQPIRIQKNRNKIVRNYRCIPDWTCVDIYTIAIKTSIPGMGYRSFNYQLKNNVMPSKDEFTYKEFYPQIRYPGSMQTDHNSWDNDVLNLCVNENGTLNITDKDSGRSYNNLLLFEDSGDIGDGWNYRKVINDSKIITNTGDCRMSVEADGPFVTIIRIDRCISMPESVSYDQSSRSSDENLLKIKTYITLKKGSRRIEFRSQFHNNIKNHRLRVLFPTNMQSDKFYTTTPFDLYERPISRPDYSDYIELDTRVSPNQGISVIRDKDGSLALYNKGLYEVEIADDKSRTLALTLLRSFPNEVGRNEGDLSYLQRHLTFEYAIRIGGKEETNANLLLDGNIYREGIRTISSRPHEGRLPVKNSFMKMNMANAVISCFKGSKKDKEYVLRIYNLSDETTQGTLEFSAPVDRINILNMKEEIIGRVDFDDSINIKLEPKKIITLGINFK